MGSDPFVMQRFKDFIEPGVKITNNYLDENSLQIKPIVTTNMAVHNGDTLEGKLMGWKCIRYQVSDDVNNLSEVVERRVNIISQDIGLLEQQNGNTLGAFPNSSNGNFTFTTFNCNVNVVVFDTARSRVMEQCINNPNGNSFSIKSTFKPRIYQLQVNHNNQQAFVKVTVR